MSAHPKRSAASRAPVKPARTQTLVQLNTELVAALDVEAARIGESRSAVIRAALKVYLDAAMERTIDQQYVDGYTRIPADDEFDDLAAASLTLLEEEDPW